MNSVLDNAIKNLKEILLISMNSPHYYELLHKAQDIFSILNSIFGRNITEKMYTDNKYIKA